MLVQSNYLEVVQITYFRYFVKLYFIYAKFSVACRHYFNIFACADGGIESNDHFWSRIFLSKLLESWYFSDVEVNTIFYREIHLFIGHVIFCIKYFGRLETSFLGKEYLPWWNCINTIYT